MTRQSPASDTYCSSSCPGSFATRVRGSLTSCSPLQEAQGDTQPLHSDAFLRSSCPPPTQRLVLAAYSALHCVPRSLPNSINSVQSPIEPTLHHIWVTPATARYQRFPSTLSAVIAVTLTSELGLCFPLLTFCGPCCSCFPELAASASCRWTTPHLQNHNHQSTIVGCSRLTSGSFRDSRAL